MPKKSVTSFVVVSVALLLLWGILTTGAQIKKKAGTKEGEKPEAVPTGWYEERLRAIRTEFEAERQRLGLDRAAYGVKYPTPEIKLCSCARVVPGATADVVVKGKFALGTRFLLDNENVEVVQETPTTSEYRATVRVAPGGGPGAAAVHPITPNNLGYLQCNALYIGGQYEWDFTAQNGWRIKLKTLSERSSAKQECLPKPVYCAEFYRGTEVKPFETRGVEVSFGGQNRYSGDIEGYDCDIAAKLAKALDHQDKRMAEMARLQEQQAAEMKRYRESPEFKKQQQEAAKQAEKLQKSKELQELKKYENVDPDKLSEKERAELMERAMRLAMEQAKGQRAGEEEEEEEQAPKKAAKPTPKAPQPPQVKMPAEEVPDPIFAKTSTPEFIMESKEKKQEFCPSMTFWLKQGNVEGTIQCAEKTGILKLHGTVKYIGQPTPNR